MGYAPPFTYRITIEGLEGHHGEGSDAQQQRKEEAEAGQEQEERCRSVRQAQPGQTRHLVHEPIRQEALAGDHVLVPLGRDPYCARSTLETEMPTGYREVVQSDKRLWLYSAFRRRWQRCVCPHLGC